MKFRQRMLASLFCLALIPSSALFLQADDQNYDNRNYDNRDYNNQADPPSRAARLQYMSGAVSVQPHGTEEWAAGTVNRPLTNSDNIWADKDSRAEVNVGTGLIRLDSETSLTLTNISENAVQLQLHQGAMTLHVRRLYEGEAYEVDTPNQAFIVSKPGDYRFDVDSDSDKTVITVWRGEGEATGSGPAVRIREGQQARFADGTNTSAADLHSAPSLDDFDRWSSSRDQRLDHSASARYVSPDVVGYEDLDEYGSWRNTSQYGSLWVPSRVDAGWAPYRDGHWIWVDPWGWTWVDDEPWGYAPFHYGRWVYADNYWGWAPGPIYVRPYYAPALVAWFGGGGWGVGIGFGGGNGYGWCPLGFGEPYIPWYGVSRGYFNQVNITNTHITNITNITNIYNNTYVNNHPGRGNGYGDSNGNGWTNNIRYANMHSPNGFTAVPKETMLNSRSVARNALRVSPNELSRVTPVRSLDMKPTRTTMLGANAGSRAAAPPPRSFVRPVMSRSEMQSGGRGNAGGRVNAGANVAYGKGSQPNWGGIAQRPNGAMNNGSAQRPVGNNNGPQRPMGNNGAIQRPTEVPNSGMANRGMERPSPNSNVRMPQSGALSERSVPRPPNVGGMYNPGTRNPAMNNGMRAGVDNGPRSNVARPTMGNEINRGAPAMRPQQSVPRPSGNPYSSAGDRSNYPSASNNRSEISRPAPSYPSNNRGNGSYSRPEASYGSNRGSYGRPAPSNEGNYNRPSPSYNRPSPSYSRPQPSNEGNYNRPSPSYNRPSPSYNRPQPSYGGGGNSRPSPNYGGGGGSYSRPAPSYERAPAQRPVPSYGGGGGRPAPSYGGGGGRAPSYSGGGGHASAPSGGGGHGNAADPRNRK